MPPRFLQLHVLTSYPAALLNRDDAGFAKRIPFGGVTRTRVSSQCLKRHWRTFDGTHGLHELGVPGSVRSRHTFERYIATPLVGEGIDRNVADAVTEALMAQVLGQSAKAKRKKDAGDDGEIGLQTGQITVLGHPEVDYLLRIARAAAETVTDPKKAEGAVKAQLTPDGRKNLQTMKRAAGLDAALFGRMVTSDILARGDAAVHVAHAFTVHAENTESVYFSAVDDLLREDDDTQLGSGHIGSAELTSGLYYGYVVVDLPLLVSNLEGCEPNGWESADRTLAAEVVDRLVRLVATVSPGAKKGSTAPYACAHLVLAETGTSQPRTFANAFLKPVREAPDLLANTYEALRQHAADLDAMYGASTQRRLAGLGPADAVATALTAERGSLAELAAWCGQQVRS
jgi:CRISPR system Cascade subunit CasC